MEEIAESGEGSEEECKMKKTVVFEFPDDFKFPKHFMQENIKKTRILKTEYNGERKVTWDDSSCRECPLRVSASDEDFYCLLIGYYQEERRECPFYRGQEVEAY